MITMIMTMKMKRRASGIIASVFLTACTLTLSAQEEIETAAPPLQDWRQVLAVNPDSTEELYIRAEAIYTDLFRTTGEKAYIDSVLMILSQRTLYFNNKPSNDLQKSLFLFEFGGNDTMYTEQCYNLIKEVADSFPDHLDHNSSVLLMYAAARSYSLSIIDTTEVLAAYLKAAGTVETQLEIRPGDTRYIAAAKEIDSIFRSGGAMTCSSIEQIYSQKVDRDLHDTVLINKVFKLLTEKDCSRSDFYYRIAVKIYANERSAENAVRLAELNIARKNRDKAVGYFTEAFKADTSKIVQSEVVTTVAEVELAEGKRQ